ncbi:hypothetical protein LTR09_011724 [Extremus antarcticus]|uniref:Uncharacterized protein n=1 Tax=Extremus antarcticus TaxID=702011 RepID=A0AAJ0G7E9_9PEZI|nr:hypothetical protein LTR09_011724 [Extremus antarcticus]
MERQPQQQSRDDGNYARGRSPPPFRREDAILQENISPSPDEEIGNESDESPILLMNLDDDEILDSLMDEIEREIQNHIAVERDYYDSDGTEDRQISPLCLDNELLMDDQQTLEAIAGIADSDAEGETTPESSESEDSDEDLDDLEILNISVEGL